jgi:methylated-DNA-protein-cysteine methyltransferase-like protein
MPKHTFTEEVIEIIREIPEGKVTSYGRIAKTAGNPRAARQVVRVLHTYGEKEDLPWWRVINSVGQIMLKAGNGFEEQCDLLEAEGVGVSSSGRINLDQFLWKPEGMDEI